MTYTELFEAHKARLIDEKGEVSPQVLVNHRATLNSYLAYCGKTTDNRVGREFTIDFIKQSAAFVKVVFDNPHTRTDKLAILRAWHKTVSRLERKSKLNPPSGTSLFHQELRVAIAAKGESIAALARAVGAQPNTISKWLAGAYPFKKGLPTFRRLERYLGFERGYLEAMIVFPTKTADVSHDSSNDQFTQRLAKTRGDLYLLRNEQFSPELAAEWTKLLKYKTTEYPIGLKRNKMAKWRSIPVHMATPGSRHAMWCYTSKTQYCPTAERTIAMVKGYLGFLAKEATGEFPGLGLPLEDVQTLAVFMIPEYLNAYLEFMKARSNDIVHAGHGNLAGVVGSFARAGDGYLAQQPQLYAKVEKHANGRTWAELCQQTQELCQHWQATAKLGKSRDPAAPLETLLNQKDPMEPFRRAVKKLDAAAANSSPGSVFQATYKRNALILLFLLSLPVRERTLTVTRYIAPGESSEYTSNLTKSHDGRWTLKYGRTELKNGDSKPAEFIVKLPEKLNRRLEEYLDEYRPILLRKHPTAPWLFPSTRGTKHSTLSDTLARIAKNFIPEVGRLRVQAMRHIVATDRLKQRPGEFQYVAELLHDNFATVVNNYAHQKTESAFQAHEERLGSLFEGI